MQSYLYPKSFGINYKMFCVSHSDSVTPWTIAHQVLCPWNSLDRILKWVAMPFSRGSFQPRDQTLVSCIAGGFFTIWTIREALSRKNNFLIKYLSKYFGFGVHGHCKQAVWLIQNSVLISNHPNSKSHIVTLLFPTVLIDFHVNMPMKLEI